MSKPWYTITAAAAGKDAAEIAIFDVINPYYGITAKQFIEDFKAKTKDTQKVNLSINSPGGEVFNGFAIYNFLVASGKDIHVKVMGIAASMASVIAMAGKTIEMPSNAMIMVHNASNPQGGTADDHREMADLLDKIDSSIVGIYTARTGKDEATIRALMGDVSYMSASEALDNGFITKVVEPVKATASFDVDDLPANVQALFKPPVTPEPKPATASLSDHIEAAAKAAGLEAFAGVWATDDKLATVEAVDKIIAEAKEITAVAKLAGRADDAAMLIRSRKTLSEARMAINAAMVAADPSQQTAPKSKDLQAKDNQYNPAAVWAAINEMNARSAK